MPRTAHNQVGRRGFSIIELMFAIAVIFLIMGLILGALRYATRSGRKAADQTTLNSLKLAVDEFKKEFGFWPAMVDDLHAPDPVTGTPPAIFVKRVDADYLFLRGGSVAGPPLPVDMRFSVYTPAYYLIGALDIDGKAGPGMRTPSADGGFSSKGREFPAFFDADRNDRAVFVQDVAKGRVELRDSYNVAFRYYRWLPEPGSPTSPTAPLNDHLNIPALVGDPAEQPELRSAEWAIVAAGPDGLFGDEPAIDQFTTSNHPQAISLTECRDRLGLPGTATLQDVFRKASADNLVVFGGARK